MTKYLPLTFLALAAPLWLFSIFYIYWWVPQCKTILADHDVQLSALTLFILNVSDWIPVLTRQTFPMVGAGLVSLIFLVLFWLSMIKSLRGVLIPLSIGLFILGALMGLVTLYATNEPLITLSG